MIHELEKYILQSVQETLCRIENAQQNENWFVQNLRNTNDNYKKIRNLV